MFKIVPVKKQHRLSMIWPLPPVLPDFRSKPNRYLSHLVGHEGAGSILVLLKKLGMCLCFYRNLGCVLRRCS
jgi:secreted Zn-dependent insulinase-like peptidase